MAMSVFELCKSKIIQSMYLSAVDQSSIVYTRLLDFGLYTNTTHAFSADRACGDTKWGYVRIESTHSWVHAAPRSRML